MIKDVSKGDEKLPKQNNSLKYIVKIFSLLCVPYSAKWLIVFLSINNEKLPLYIYLSNYCFL